jgi:tetratricopeptide (TPR) repeat protein
MPRKVVAAERMARQPAYWSLDLACRRNRWWRDACTFGAGSCPDRHSNNALGPRRITITALRSHYLRVFKGQNMSRRARLNQCLAVLFSFALGPAVLAQSSHLRALSDWMAHQQEAAKCFQRGDYSQAAERLNLAIKDLRPYLPDTRRIMAKTYCDLAQVLYHQQRYDEAEPLARWALSVREADKQARPDAVSQCLYVLGRIQSARKKYAEAEQFHLRSLALQEKSWGRDHINTIAVLDQLAVVYIEQAKYSDAESIYLRSIAILERNTPAGNPDLAETAQKYAVLLRLMKRNDDADRWHARAVEIRDTN